MDLTAIVSDMWAGYTQLQGTHPVIGSILTAEVIFPFSDALSQAITDQKVDWKKVRYTAALASIYGAVAYAQQQSGELVGKYVYDHPLAKAVLGPNLWGNVVNMFFFMNNTVGERNEYRLDGLVEHYRSLIDNPKQEMSWLENVTEKVWGNVPTKEYLNAVIGTLTFWNVFQYFNYSYVEEAMRTPASIVVSVGWMTLMSLWSLNGRRRIVDEIGRAHV